VGRDATGARLSAAGCGTGQRGEAVGVALTAGVGSKVRPIRFSNRIKFISNGFKFAANFDRSKRCLLVLKKIQIKYELKEIQIRNNFPYRNFSRFEIEFELIFGEVL
jgi:hypothetical protein